MEGIWVNEQIFLNAVSVSQKAAFSWEKQNIAKFITKLPKFHNHNTEMSLENVGLQTKNY